jgi:dihydroflavonol-4-reductase
MSILVTGGTGFLGGQLVAALRARGEAVRVLRRSSAAEIPEGVESAIGDVTRPETLAAALAGVSRVYHIAGRVDFDPDAAGRARLVEVNVEGTRHLLEAAASSGVERVVHVSSVSTIGGSDRFDRVLRESDFGRGTGVDLPYPSSKRAGEEVALEFARRGLPVVIVNPTFFAGPGDRNLSSARTMVSFLKRQVWLGLTRGAVCYSDVRDVADGMIRAMERGRVGERYILGGHNLRLSEYHAILRRVTGVRQPLFRVPPPVAIACAHVVLPLYRLLGITTYVAPGDVRMGRNWWVYDYSKARDELGLVCRDPESSIRDAVAWLKGPGRPYWK